MTVAAVVIGVATVTFAIGLHNSLTRVASGITRDRQVQLEIERAGETKSGPAELSDRRAASLIAAQPGTARMVGEGHADVTVPGAPHPVSVTAYQGDASWLGYVPIHGRWFTVAGEAVAPTAFFTSTGHRLGDTIAATYSGRTTRLTLVGEIFDPGRWHPLTHPNRFVPLSAGNLELRGAATTRSRRRHLRGQS
jgi:putative ABC transport system permease protein